MRPFDVSRPVMVTGATGYVAGWLVKRLLDRGLTVHACVRNPADSEMLKYLDAATEDAPGRIRYFRSDLLEQGSYTEAMQGCGVVFHTASPFTLSVKNPQAELVDPALLGTRNVLASANSVNTVQRIVVTSSTAAIYCDNVDLQNTASGRFTERDWNTGASLTHQPYSYSKTLAEREAWRIASEQQRWTLVTINPSFVLGPGINPFATSETFTLFKQFADGTARIGVPDLRIGAVDVRDVADAHVAAGFTATASGRYIISAHHSSFMDIARILRTRFGDGYPFPRRKLPKSMVWLMGPLFNSSLTRRIVSRNVGLPVAFDNSRGIGELGMAYRPIEDSVTDLFQQLVDNGMA